MQKDRLDMIKEKAAALDDGLLEIRTVRNRMASMELPMFGSPMRKLEDAMSAIEAYVASVRDEIEMYEEEMAGRGE